LLWLNSGLTACWAARVNPDILNNLEAGYRAFLAEDYDEAVKLYTQVIRDKRLYARDRAVTYLLRGEALMYAGDNKGANKDFLRATKIKPNYSQAYYFRGLTFERMGNLSEAYQEVRKALSYQPDNVKYQDKLTAIRTRLTNKGESVPED
jgi:tetratricopeptide (TPR) repeat protein